MKIKTENKFQERNNPMYQALAEAIKLDVANVFNMKDLSVVFGEGIVRTVIMWRTKKNKPATLSVSLRQREGDQIRTEWYGNPNTKEANVIADTVLDSMLKHLYIIKDENLMYTYVAMLGVEYYRGYQIAEQRGVRKKSNREVSEGPKISEIRARLSEIEAKHQELLKVTWEETKGLYKLDYDEGVMFKMQGRCRAFLNMLKELNIVSDFNYWGTSGFTVYFTRAYQAPQIYIYEEWAKVFREFGFKADTETYYRD